MSISSQSEAAPKPRGLLIGIPYCGGVDMRCSANQFALERPPCMWLFFCPLHGHDPAAQRNQIIASGIAESNPAWFLFLDSDVLVPANIIPHLLALDLPVVSGIVPARGISGQAPVVREAGNGPYLKWKVGERFEVEGTGAACLFVAREVIDAIEPPWFEWSEGESEDMAFCRKAREAGYSITVDAAIQCGHILEIDGPILFTPQYEEWIKHEGKERPRFGRSMDEGYFFSLTRKTTELTQEGP